MLKRGCALRRRYGRFGKPRSGTYRITAIGAAARGTRPFFETAPSVEDAARLALRHIQQWPSVAREIGPGTFQGFDKRGALVGAIVHVERAT